MEHRFYISILEGDSAASATPVMATGDPAIVDAVLATIAKRLGVDVRAKVLRLEEHRRPPADDGRSDA